MKTSNNSTIDQHQCDTAEGAQGHGDQGHDLQRSADDTNVAASPMCHVTDTSALVDSHVSCTNSYSSCVGTTDTCNYEHLVAAAASQCAAVPAALADILCRQSFML